MIKCNSLENGAPFHKLIVIYEGPIFAYSNEVVRWCSECGAIVVDEDYDGRTKPGAIMKMRLPKVLL